MIKNTIVIAYRNLVRNKLFSIINISGLALGIASFIICYFHLRFELSYDKFHQESESIYRVISGDLEEDDYWVMMAAPIPPVLKNEFPEVEEFVRMAFISWDPKITVEVDNRSFNEENFFLVDPSFFSIFDFNLILGDPETVLNDKDAVVITQSHAQKYYGTDDPLGKMIEVNGKYLFRISGVIEDPPLNSHLEYSFLASFENLAAVYGQGAPASWGSFNYYAYLKLNSYANVDDLGDKIRAHTFRASEDRQISFEMLDLQQIHNIHFQSNRGNLKPSYSMTYIYIFWALAVTLIIIASINYINLSTAQSEKRIREVALRKTFGATRSKIMIQMMSETLIITLFSFILALLLVRILAPFLGNLLNQRIDISLADPFSIMVFVGIVVLISLISGMYISIYITNFQPVEIIKGNSKLSSGDISLRKALLFIQFVIVSLVIICSLTIYRQLKFIQQAEIGLNKENVVDILIYNDEAREKIPLYKNRITGSPLIVSAAASAFKPGEANFNQTVKWDGQEEDMSMFLIPADKHFISSMGLTLLEGDLAQIEAISDSTYTWILNESARKAIGWDNAYGKSFTAFSSERSKRPVAGVVKDFNFMSLHHEVAPLVLVIGNAFDMDRISVRINSNQVRDAMVYLEATFKEIFPGVPFDYQFLDEALNDLYNNEIWTGKIIGLITVIIIGLSVFGLFGLLSFSLKERTREIAIRKVHGITNVDLAILLTRNYLLLVLSSIILSIPAAWYLMDKWLQNFSYRINVSPGIIIVSMAIIFGLVIVSILHRTLAAVRTNTAEALKYY